KSNFAGQKITELAMHVAAWFVGAALAVMPACASAHVTVWPKESAAGAREKYEIRVPNEKQVNTVGIELRFPNGVRVTSLEQVPGWSIVIDRDGAGNIVGAQWRGQLQRSNSSNLAFWR
ncbi:MAG: DUF1775 domain-containing protein, partial [Novosphingobium sp.]|nr:DUF1775 domain-containing protein [Novosphingobium sp.]